MSLLFGFLTQTLVTNQVATGLALTLFGLGLSGLLGEPFTGLPGVKLSPVHIPGLSDLPFVGPVLFGHDVLVYASIAITVLAARVLARTRIGLVIRATGDNHHSAHALGYNVIAVRYACIAFGGACAGLAGGYLSLAYTTQWIENMTARARLGRAGAGGLRHLGAAPGRSRGLPVRHRVDHGPLCTGGRARYPAPAPRVAALPGHHRRPDTDLRKPRPDESEHARLHRSPLRAGPVTRAECPPAPAQ